MTQPTNKANPPSRRTRFESVRDSHSPVSRMPVRVPQPTPEPETKPEVPGYSGVIPPDAPGHRGFSLP